MNHDSVGHRTLTLIAPVAACVMSLFVPAELTAQSAGDARSASAPLAPTYAFSPVAVPGADLTVPTGINDRGAIAGFILGPFLNNTNNHGFLIEGGGVTILDVPDAVNGTAGAGIDDEGRVVGQYDKAGAACGVIGSVSSGFLYHGGVYSTFDAPGGTDGTFPSGIDAQGGISGSYRDESCVSHGFLNRSGQFTTLDVPGAFGTEALGLDDRGDVVGVYVGADDLAHGFVYQDGNYRTLDHPAAVYGTYLFGISHRGEMVGFYLDSSVNARGFVYSRGSFVSLDAPGATHTEPLGINDAGAVVGLYIEVVPAPPSQCKFPPCFDEIFHGFVARPVPPGGE